MSCSFVLWIFSGFCVHHYLRVLCPSHTGLAQCLTVCTVQETWQQQYTQERIILQTLSSPHKLNYSQVTEYSYCKKLKMQHLSRRWCICTLSFVRYSSLGHMYNIWGSFCRQMAYSGIWRLQYTSLQSIITPMLLKTYRRVILLTVCKLSIFYSYWYLWPLTNNDFVWFTLISKCSISAIRPGLFLLWRSLSHITVKQDVVFRIQYSELETAWDLCWTTCSVVWQNGDNLAETAQVCYICRAPFPWIVDQAYNKARKPSTLTDFKN